MKGVYQRIQGLSTGIWTRSSARARAWIPSTSTGPAPRPISRSPSRTARAANVRAARAAGLPVVISFTVETDGRLPSGRELRDAVEEVDGGTDGAAAYFMINCAHPSHFHDVLDPGGAWTGRIRGIRANASRSTHAELDEAEELDMGDPEELADARWFTRAEVLAVLERRSDAFRLPNRSSIAYRLVSTWAAR